jgi:uncharacterized membrane protein YphA (DoxX/SURF4 family)
MDQQVYTLTNVLQIVIAMGLLNVWLLRFNQNTPYRGGNARSLMEEFSSYGLPSWFRYFIGFLKLSCALLLIIGIWVPGLVLPTALLLSVLMIGAILMHVKIGDPLKKSLPALLMLVLSFSTCVTSL